MWKSTQAILQLGTTRSVMSVHDIWARPRIGCVLSAGTNAFRTHLSDIALVQYVMGIESSNWNTALKHAVRALPVQYPNSSSYVQHGILHVHIYYSIYV